MTVACLAPAWGRLRAGFRSRAVAHPPGEPIIPLGEYRANSPRLAMRWMRARAEHVAEQLDAPDAYHVHAWLLDGAELAWALEFIAGGEPYVFKTVDSRGIRFVFLTEPIGMFQRFELGDIKNSGHFPRNVWPGKSPDRTSQ